MMQQDPGETFYPGYSYAAAAMFESNLPKVILGMILLHRYFHFTIIEKGM